MSAVFTLTFTSLLQRFHLGGVWQENINVNKKQLIYFIYRGKYYTIQNNTDINLLCTEKTHTMQPMNFKASLLLLNGKEKSVYIMQKMHEKEQIYISSRS